MADQPLSSQLNATHNPQQLDNQTPSYQVASQNVNQPKRLRRWFGYNVLAFMFAFAVFYGFVICILMVAVYEPFNLDWIDNPRLNPMLSIGIPGVLIGLSAMVGTTAQRDGLNKRVSFWPWILKTGLITTIISSANVAIFIFMLQPQSLFNKNTRLISMLYFIACIGLITLATAMAQLSEVKKIAQRPNDWVKITVLTWTGIACILGGCIYIIW
ncbi:hypothetical protein [Herpetosiphon giganteus]|uniref:hypothetical protein n=1 Tax=Herpetosiphon giganteus TaxID=2029754 RepID=UPI00195C6BBB|nr:hypothetical protein [Herpetosiphon giganteus]MBM7842422.1 cadmium resistance protein CadD (predicted permease) [Herpetosiphon giganteus]